MPNWVYNKIKIDARLLGHILNADGEVDFSIAVPEPEEMKYTQSPAPEDAIAAYLYSQGQKDRLRKLAAHSDRPVKAFLTEIRNAYAGRKGIDGSDERLSKYPTIEEWGKLHLDLEKKYGCSNWYDFHNLHWGCKWNACETCVEMPGEDEKFAYITFNTPWGPPDRWLYALAEQHIPFYLSWEEEQGYRGWFLSDGENCNEEELPEISYYDVGDMDLDSGDCFSIQAGWEETIKKNSIQRYSLDEDDCMLIADDNGDLISREDAANYFEADVNGPEDDLDDVSDEAIGKYWPELVRIMWRKSRPVRVLVKAGDSEAAEKTAISSCRTAVSTDPFPITATWVKCKNETDEIVRELEENLGEDGNTIPGYEFWDATGAGNMSHITSSLIDAVKGGCAEDGMKYWLITLDVPVMNG